MEKYVPQCTKVLWFELDKILTGNNLSLLTVNVLSITGKIPDLVTNLKLFCKRFIFIIITGSWLTEEFNLVVEINGYKSLTIIKVRLTCEGIKIFHLETTTTDVICQVSLEEDSYECDFF